MDYSSKKPSSYPNSYNKNNTLNIEKKKNNISNDITRSVNNNLDTYRQNNIFHTFNLEEEDNDSVEVHKNYNFLNVEPLNTPMGSEISELTYISSNENINLNKNDLTLNIDEHEVNLPGYLAPSPNMSTISKGKVTVVNSSIIDSKGPVPLSNKKKRGATLFVEVYDLPELESKVKPTVRNFEILKVPDYLWFDNVAVNWIYQLLPLFAFIPTYFLYAYQLKNYIDLIKFRMLPENTYKFSLFNTINSFATLFLDFVFYFFLFHQSLSGVFSLNIAIVSIFILYFTSLFTSSVVYPIESRWKEAFDSYIGDADDVAFKQSGKTKSSFKGIRLRGKIDDLDLWNEFKFNPPYLYTSYSKVENLYIEYYFNMALNILCPIISTLQIYLTPFVFESLIVSQKATFPQIELDNRKMNTLGLPNLTLSQFVNVLPYHYWGGIMLFFLQVSHILCIAYLLILFLLFGGNSPLFSYGASYTFSYSNYGIVFLVVKVIWSTLTIVHYFLFENPIRRHYYSVFVTWLLEIKFDYSKLPSNKPNQIVPINN